MAVEDDALVRARAATKRIQAAQHEIADAVTVRAHAVAELQATMTYREIGVLLGVHYTQLHHEMRLRGIRGEARRSGSR